MENNMENQQETIKKQKNKVNSANSSNKQIIYGGFWARLAAYFIDRLVIGLGFVILIMPIGFLVGFYSSAYSVEEEVFGFVFGLLIAVIMLVANFGYFVYMTYKYQATLGKMAVGVRVLNEDGNKPTLKEVMMREVLGKIVSYFTMKIGYLIAAFTDKKQSLHDMIGKTIVVTKDQEKGSNKVIVSVVNTCFIGFYVVVTIFYLFMLVVLFISEMDDYPDYENYSDEYYNEYIDYDEDYSNYEF